MKTRRNDPCPCGSGRKYKHCCLGKDREEEPRITLPPAAHAAAGEATTWEIDLLPIGGVGEDAGDAGAVVCLVVADGIAVRADAFELSAQEPEDIAAVLEEQIMEAGRMVGSLPACVRVGDREVAANLVDRLGPRGVEEIDTAPFRFLVDAGRSLLEGLHGEGAWPPAGARGSWEGWGRSEAEVEDLFRVAADFFRAAPWNTLHGDFPVIAFMPGGRRWACSVLGSGGEEHGLGLYSEIDDFLVLLDLAPGEHWEHQVGRVYGLLFENRDALPRRMQREVAGKGWEVAAPDAYPMLWSVRSPGGGMSRADWNDMVALLDAIPRFVAASEELPDADLAAAWHDEKTDVEFLFLPWDRLGDEREPLTPGGPRGPGADPEAALGASTWEGDEEGDLALLDGFADWLDGQGLAESTVKKHTGNAEELLYFLREIQGVPLSAMHEFDFRTFFFDWTIRKSGLGKTRLESLPASLGRFFDFLAYRKGIQFEWGKKVLAERDWFRDRAERCPWGGFWSEDTRDWLGELTLDLHARVLLPNQNLGEDDQWGPTMGPVEWGLHTYLQRSWLLWREEMIEGGVTDPEAVREELEKRQRRWEAEPSDEAGGRTPMDAVREEREDRGPVPPFP